MKQIKFAGGWYKVHDTKSSLGLTWYKIEDEPGHFDWISENSVEGVAEERDMFTVEEIWEEQERQYNQLMEEDDQYCHPESFRWGFEHGVDYALTKAGWHPASEAPELGEDDDNEFIVITSVDNELYRHGPKIDKPKKAMFIDGQWTEPDVKWWCWPPEKQNAHN